GVDDERVVRRVAVARGSRARGYALQTTRDRSEVSVPVAGGGGTAARARAVQFLASAGHGAEGRSEDLLETPHLLVDVGVALLAATVALGVCGIADPGGLLVRDPHHLGFREHALLFLSRLGDRP